MILFLDVAMERHRDAESSHGTMQCVPCMQGVPGVALARDRDEPKGFYDSSMHVTQYPMLRLLGMSGWNPPVVVAPKAEQGPSVPCLWVGQHLVPRLPKSSVRFFSPEIPSALPYYGEMLHRQGFTKAVYGWWWRPASVQNSAHALAPDQEFKMFLSLATGE